MFGRRPDGELVRDLPAVRRFMPFLSPRRNESLVYFAQEVDVEPALGFLERVNRDRRADRRVTLFHLLLRAIARTLEERPRLNRFVAGGRLWQRDGVYLTFSAKRSFDEDAPILTVKRRFEPGESLEEMVEGILVPLRARRAGRRDTADAEVDMLLRLPPPLVRLAMGLVELVDAFGLLPRRMIEPDPMYTSAFVANLGSVGLDAGYHHLWEHGTCPLFCVMGRIREGTDGRRRMTLKWTYDERVEDGFYCARATERLRELLEKPEHL